MLMPTEVSRLSRNLMRDTVKALNRKRHARCDVRWIALIRARPSVEAWSGEAFERGFYYPFVIKGYVARQGIELEPARVHGIVGPDKR